MSVPARAAALLSSLFLVTFLAGCVKDAPTMLEGSVAATDDANESAPVVMRYFELKSAEGFDSADFFDLYEKPEATLGSDLLGSGEVELIPGATKPLKAELNPDTRVVGFLVAYRDIDNSSWRGSMPVESAIVNKVAVEVGKAEVSVNPG